MVWETCTLWKNFYEPPDLWKVLSTGWWMSGFPGSKADLGFFVSDSVCDLVTSSPWSYITEGLTCWVNHFFIPSCVPLITASYQHLTGVVSFEISMESCSGKLLELGRHLPVNKQLDLPAVTCDRTGCVGVHVCILQGSCDKCTACLEGLV